MKNTETPAARLTAESILKSFLISGKRHLFITGSKSSGKTTLISDIKALISNGRKLSGITTKSYKADRVEMIDDSSGKIAIIGRYDNTLKAETNKMRLVKDGFFQVGIPALETAVFSQNEWITIDEIGYIENACREYQHSILNVLEKKRIIAVIRKDNIAFLNDLLNRKDAFVLDLDTPVLPIACIISASGIGKRFGSNKLLVELNCKPLIQHTIDSIPFNIFAKVIVVTRHKKIEKLCKEQNIDCILHDFDDKSNAIRLSIEAAKGFDGCIFCNADQPLVAKTSFEALALAFSQNPRSICRLAFENTAASPVIFSKDYYDELASLPQDSSGKYVIERHKEKIILVSAERKKELWDVDTPKDLEKFEKEMN